MAILTHYVELSDDLADHLATESGALEAYESALEGRREDARSLRQLGRTWAKRGGNQRF